MHLFIEERMIGGVSYVVKWCSEASNKYMIYYADKKPSKYITYLDANNLYGWEMSHYLPYGEFKWLNQKEIDKFDVNSIKENSSNGYILEADPEYPDELHIFHNDYLLALEKLEISDDMLSKYCSDIAIVGGGKKLIPNLGNKSKYIVHYQNLQLYLALGMKLTKIHKILKFKQFDWLKTYIDSNTKKKQKKPKNAANNFEKKEQTLKTNKNWCERI